MKKLQEKIPSLKQPGWVEGCPLPFPPFVMKEEFTEVKSLSPTVAEETCTPS